jgi:hypothetical protein
VVLSQTTGLYSSYYFSSFENQTKEKKKKNQMNAPKEKEKTNLKIWGIGKCRERLQYGSQTNKWSDTGLLKREKRKKKTNKIFRNPKELNVEV